MKPFRELTRRARLYRLREIAREALKAYGMEDARLSFLQYFENIIYRVDIPGGHTHTSDAGWYSPNRYLLRIHAMCDREAIASELTWLSALSQEAGLPVPAPVPTINGELLVTINTPSMPNGRVVSLMRWLDGHCIRGGLKPKQYFAMGKAVALMHNFSAGWKPPPGFTRPVWDWDSQLGGSMFDYPVEELVQSMPDIFREPFQFVSQAAKAAMVALGIGPDAFGMIHADLYPENVLFKAGQALPIDFEDCGYGYWIWDIAVALCSAWDQDWEPIRDAFREGYEQSRMLPDSQWNQLDLFIATQFATMVLWASAFLKNDPNRIAEYTPWRDGNGAKLAGYFKMNY